MCLEGFVHCTPEFNGNGSRSCVLFHAQHPAPTHELITLTSLSSLLLVQGPSFLIGTARVWRADSILLLDNHNSPPLRRAELATHEHQAI